MKHLLILAAVSALTVARPELYKEQEDFKFSRSSSDDGTKSGYYGAQRGNMGGNYERAHNMDSLAQNQMSGLVRQVEGELGDGFKTNTGSVYSAANSRGTYGAGHFDLNNLAGRNFQEGTYSQNSQRHSSRSQSTSDSAGYTDSMSQSGDSRYGGYQSAASDAQTQTDNLQSLVNSQSSNQYGYERQASRNSGYHSASGFQEHNENDRSNANLQSGYGSGVHTRLISATPVKIILTPGGRVAIPVAAQTYEITQRPSVLDVNTVNRESDISSRNSQGVLYRPSTDNNYQSSYSYHKSWEKHDTLPMTFVSPTESTIPKNSELYGESDGRRIDSYVGRGAETQSAQSSAASGRYNAIKSSASQSRYRSNFNTRQEEDSATNSNTFSQTGFNGGSNRGSSLDSASSYHGAISDTSINAHTQAALHSGSHTDLNSQVENLNTKPKSYQSSYSYHKSWERQGDPYVIKPSSNGYYDSQSSQRLTSSTKNAGYMAHNAGSYYGSQDQDDCDDNSYKRVPRSYFVDDIDTQQQSQNIYEVGQEAQNTWDNFDHLNQQSISNTDQQNIEQLQNFGHESENKLDNTADLGQQTVNLVDLGQQTENKRENTVDLGQQTENKWDNVADLGQQTENKWDNVADLGQQTENKWADIENMGQQAENKFDTTTNLEQQTENKLDHIEDLGQQSQKKWDNIEDLGQHSSINWDKLENIGQRSVDRKTDENLENIGQVQNSRGEHKKGLQKEERDDQAFPNYDVSTPKADGFVNEVVQRPNNKQQNWNSNRDLQFLQLDTTTNAESYPTVNSIQFNSQEMPILNFRSKSDVNENKSAFIHNSSAQIILTELNRNKIISKEVNPPSNSQNHQQLINASSQQYQSISPQPLGLQIYKNLVNDTHLFEDSIFKGLERPVDIGRSDVDSEDILSESHIFSFNPKRRHLVKHSIKKSGNHFIKNEVILNNDWPDIELSVLGLEKKENLITQTKPWVTIEPRKYTDKYNTTKIQKGYTSNYFGNLFNTMANINENRGLLSTAVIDHYFTQTSSSKHDLMITDTPIQSTKHQEENTTQVDKLLTVTYTQEDLQNIKQSSTDKFINITNYQNKNNSSKQSMITPNPNVENLKKINTEIPTNVTDKYVEITVKNMAFKFIQPYIENATNQPNAQHYHNKQKQYSNLEKNEIITELVQDFEQQNKTKGKQEVYNISQEHLNKLHNITEIEKQTTSNIKLQSIGQLEENLEYQTLSQENLPNFDQHKKYLENKKIPNNNQENSQNILQQEVQDNQRIYNIIHENLQNVKDIESLDVQRIPNLGQVTVQNIVQQQETLVNQRTSYINQENLLNFLQENEILENKSIPNISQENPQTILQQEILSTERIPNINHQNPQTFVQQQKILGTEIIPNISQENPQTIVQQQKMLGNERISNISQQNPQTIVQQEIQSIEKIPNINEQNPQTFVQQQKIIVTERIIENPQTIAQQQKILGNERKSNISQQNAQTFVWEREILGTERISNISQENSQTIVQQKQNLGTERIPNTMHETPHTIGQQQEIQEIQRLPKISQENPNTNEQLQQNILGTQRISNISHQNAQIFVQQQIVLGTERIPNISQQTAQTFISVQEILGTEGIPNISQENPQTIIQQQKNLGKERISNISQQNGQTFVQEQEILGTKRISNISQENSQTIVLQKQILGTEKIPNTMHETPHTFGQQQEIHEIQRLPKISRENPQTNEQLQQNILGTQRIPNISQQNPQIFVQQRILGTERIPNISQPNAQTFVWEQEMLGTERISSISQENPHTIGQQQEIFRIQIIPKISQKNSQTIAQDQDNNNKKPKNIDNKRIFNFSQENLLNFGQQKFGQGKQKILNICQENFKKIAQEKINPEKLRNSNISNEKLQPIQPQCSGQEYLQYIEQKTNAHSNNLQNFDQTYIQRFLQKETQEQDNHQNIGNQNLKQHNSDYSGEKQLNVFGQENENLEQKNSPSFDVELAEDLGEKYEIHKQQDFRQFDRENNNLGQHDYNFENNEHRIKTHNGGIKKQYYADFGQQNLQLFQQQNQKFVHNLNTLDQETLVQFNQSELFEPSVKVICEDQDIKLIGNQNDPEPKYLHTINHNVQSLINKKQKKQPNIDNISLRNLKVFDHREHVVLLSPEEQIMEKSVKCICNKFYNAKNKIVSWFTS